MSIRSSAAKRLTMSTRSNVAEVLATLKQAVRDIKSDDNRPNAESVSSSISHKQLLIQISALHKGFLALSDAFLENIEASRQQSSVWGSNLEAVRSEFAAKLELARSLHQDLQHLVNLEGGLQAQNTMLTDRVAQLEAQLASLHEQVVEQSASTEHAIRNGVTQAANSHFEEHLQHFQQERMAPLVQAAVQQQVQQWVDTRLSGLVQGEVQRRADAIVKGAAEEHLKVAHEDILTAQQASLYAADVAAQAAADVATLAADVSGVKTWCKQTDAAHCNHEERLRRLEGAEARSQGAAPAKAMGPSAMDVQSGLPSPAGSLASMGNLLRSLEAGRGSQPSSARHWPGSKPGEAEGHDGVSPGQRERGSLQGQLQAVQVQVDSLEAVQRRLEGLLGETCEQQAQQARELQELAVQQAQQGHSVDETMHATLTDVMALARHTKLLDEEVQALQGGIGKVQEALLTCSSTFARSLNIPSPVGPYTSFPPQ